MVRTTVGTIAEAELSVEESESVTTIKASQTSTLSSSASETTTITAPTGIIIEVLAIRVRIPAPPGATTGDHTLEVEGPGGLIRYLIARSDFSTLISINDRSIQNGNLIARPTDVAAQSSAISDIRADDTRGFNLAYFNDTDVAQTNPRNIDLIVLERGVSS